MFGHKLNRLGLAGFSLMELLIVVAIALIVGAVSIPQMNKVTERARLTSSMTGVSGLLRTARGEAIQRNKTIMARHAMRTDSSVLIYYAKCASDARPDIASSDPQVRIGGNVRAYPAPEGANAPSTLSASQLGFEPIAIDASAQVFASFNSRGLACAYSGGTCRNSGFIEYFEDSRSIGKGSWAAVSVNPVGRIKLWFWNGAAWKN